MNLSTEPKAIRNELRRLESVGVPYSHRVIMYNLAEFSAKEMRAEFPGAVELALKQRNIEPTPEIVSAMAVLLRIE